MVKFRDKYTLFVQDPMTLEMGKHDGYNDT